jgi:hypothetical protein
MLPGLRTNVPAPAAISLSQRRSSTVHSQRLRMVCRAEDEKVVTLLDYGMFMTLATFATRVSTVGSLYSICIHCDASTVCEGAGNVRSVRNAIKKLGYQITEVGSKVVSERILIECCD